LANVTESVAQLSDLARDYSGYVRQAVVNRCAALALPELLPIIVSRLNDWVPEVRHAAQDATMVMIQGLPPAPLLAILPAIQHLHISGRTEHAQWIESFERNLIGRIDVEQILAATRGADIKVARACFHLLTKYRLRNLEDLPRLMMEAANDIVMAVDGARFIRELPAETQRANYSLAFKSHFGSVRTIAIRALLAVEDGSNMALAEAGLVDAQTPVRHLAAAFMRSKNVDVRQFYRDVLARQELGLSAKVAQVALASLAAMRNGADIALVKTYVTHPQLSVRKAALTAWIKMSPSEKDEVALAALMDGSESVRRFAFVAVRKHGAFIPFATVRARLTGLSDVAQLLLFAKDRGWDGLESIVEAALFDLSNVDRKRQLQTALLDWTGGNEHRYGIPNASQQAFLTSPATEQVYQDLLGGHDSSMKWLRSALSF
jgi:hypothetical protein